MREHKDPRDNRERAVASGEIGGPRPKTPTSPKSTDKQPAVPPPIPAAARRAGALEVQSTDEITQPKGQSPAVPPPLPPPPAAPPQAARGAIMGIGMSQIGSSASGEIGGGGGKVKPGGRVLVPGPNGLMQSATVRQLVSGYYELEVGSSGETIWVPFGGVVPE